MVAAVSASLSSPVLGTLSLGAGNATYEPAITRGWLTAGISQAQPSWTRSDAAARRPASAANPARAERARLRVDSGVSMISGQLGSYLQDARLVLHDPRAQWNEVPPNHRAATAAVPPAAQFGCVPRSGVSCLSLSVFASSLADPDLARDLAAAAARSARSTWCLTVTDSQGHAIGHGCARPAPPAPATARKPDTPAAPGGPGTPAAPGGPGPPGRTSFTLTPAGPPGPPGGYGTWRLGTGVVLLPDGGRCAALGTGRHRAR